MTTRKRDLTEYLEVEYGLLTFGSLLRAFREDLGLKQKPFAKKLGVTVSSLSDLENGRRVPTPERAAKIAKKLRHSPLGFVELAISDSLREAGLKFKVKLELERSA